MNGFLNCLRNFFSVIAIKDYGIIKIQYENYLLIFRRYIMEKAIMNNENTYVIGEDVSEQTTDIIEHTVISALDISTETATILSMTPRDGYQKKLDLIYVAKDLSTKEKLEEISRAEDKYAQDLEHNAETCKRIMWAKAGIIVFVIAGGAYAATTENGKKIMRSLFKIAI